MKLEEMFFLGLLTASENHIKEFFSFFSFLGQGCISEESL